MSDPIVDSALLSMCMTWRHDFGLLDRKEQMAIKRELLGLYEHHVKPALDRASSAESSLAAMRQRAEEAEAKVAEAVKCSRAQANNFFEMKWRAERAEEALLRCQRLADGGVDDPAGPYNVLAQIANTVAAVLSSPTADASTLAGYQPADPYSGELGNINLRNLAARMHAALGLLKRQGCYHPAMDSMREEGFRHGLNIGDVEPEDPSADASTMGGEPHKTALIRCAGHLLSLHELRDDPKEVQERVWKRALADVEEARAVLSGDYSNGNPKTVGEREQTVDILRGLISHLELCRDMDFPGDSEGDKAVLASVNAILEEARSALAEMEQKS